MILVIIIFLWSITKTLEKLTDKILISQNNQTELLKEIKEKLDERAVK